MSRHYDDDAVHHVRNGNLDKVQPAILPCHYNNLRTLCLDESVNDQLHSLAAGSTVGLWIGDRQASAKPGSPALTVTVFN